MRYIILCVSLVILLLAPQPLRAQPVDELIVKLAEPESAPGAVFKLAAKSSEATGALIKALSNKDDCVRYHALWALTISNEEIDGSVFVKLLEDKNPLVRLRAVFALSVKAPSQTRPVLGRLAGDPDWLVRASAATVLADHRQPEVTEALLKSLEMHKNRFAALALVSHATAAAPGLRKLLKSKSPVVRRMSCFALGRIGDRESLDALNAAAKDKDSNVAVSAAVALAIMRQDEAYSLLEEALVRRGQSAKEVPVILKKLVKALSALKNTAPEKKAGAYAELGRYGFMPPVPELVRELRKGTDRDTRASAAVALGDIGSDLALSALAESSGDIETVVRLASAVALGKIALREGVAPLRELSYDPDPGVRAAAATALANLDIKDLTPIFKRMSKDADSKVRLAAFKALDIYPPSFTEPVFISLLKKEKNAELRALLITLLGRIGTENALHIIIKEADAKALLVRIAAIEALGNFSEPRAGQKLVAALKRAGPIDEKVAAVKALGRNRSELALPVLLERIRKPGDELGPVVAEALGNLANKDAAPVLTGLLKDAKGEFASEILIALAKIAAPESLPRIIALARDKKKDIEMRRAAVVSLGCFSDDTAKNVAMSFLTDDSVAVEAAAALGMLGDDTGLAALRAQFMKAGDKWQRPMRALMLIESPAALHDLRSLAKQDSDIGLALTASLELIRRGEITGLAFLQAALAKEGAKKKLEKALREFELVQVLYPLMEKLAGAREIKTKMAIVEVLGRMEITDYRIPKDASLADYQKLTARWMRWWEATVAKLPAGAGRIRREEGETGTEREGVMNGLDWLRKKRK